MKLTVKVFCIFFLVLQKVQSKHFSLGDATLVNCPKYTCGRLPNNFCLGSGASTLFTTACPDNTYCSSSNTCSTIKSKYQDTFSYPGEKCSAGIPCKTGTCTLGTCLGKSLNEKCNSHSECEPNLRCHHTCKPLFKPKERGCITDFDCTPNSGCNFGECTEYFSLHPGSKLERCENFSSFLCESKMCDNFKCIKDQFSSEFPKECKSDQDCGSQNGYFVSCVCGANENGKSFCLPFPGDDVGKDYFGMVEEWVKSKDIEKCNTQRRFAEYCIESHWGSCLMVEYLYRMYRYQFFPVIIENPECVEKSLTQDYWKIREVFKNGKKGGKCELWENKEF